MSDQISSVMIDFSRSISDAQNARLTLGDHLRKVREQAETTKKIHEQARDAWEFEIR